jgi:hypothetical protein
VGHQQWAVVFAKEINQRGPVERHEAVFRFFGGILYSIPPFPPRTREITDWPANRSERSLEEKRDRVPKGDKKTAEMQRHPRFQRVQS